MLFEKLAKDCLGRETELVGNLLNGKARIVEKHLSLVYDIIGDNLLWRFPNGIVSNLRQIPCRDVQFIGIEMFSLSA